MLYIWN